MDELLSDAFAQAQRFADLALPVHVHNYPRFTRRPDDEYQIPYVVVAGGSWHLHYLAKRPMGRMFRHLLTCPEVRATVECYRDDWHGFLTITATEAAIEGSYTTVPRPHESSRDGPVQVVDRWRVDLATHKVTTL